METRKPISGNTLKGIAVFTMLIDHFAAVVIKGYVNAVYQELTPEQFAVWENLYDMMRNIGRTAFPLFAFLLVEGFFYTKNRKNYGGRLFLCALLSEIPFDLAVKGSLWDGELQNGLFTLFLGFLTLWVLERSKIRENSLLRGIYQLLTVAAACGAAHFFRLDYGCWGILLMTVYYVLHPELVSTAIGGFAVFAWKSAWSFPAFVLLLFYNGKRSGRRNKYEKKNAGVKKPADGKKPVGGKKPAGVVWLWTRYGCYFLFPLHFIIYYVILKLWTNS